ncbi:MAG: 4-oxalocrotonate tautomerase family protein [Euryarchaeota archaeon]|nr:4-oxalocrotonate tautomerase family protein [Euryarchaeota archaeon]MBV1730298.1 4-oxalocrotonate tautomerase family protein [Methanobacterium sp.]MBU4547607.1 4-oxalocrotonate tautomerase family protein [Euryarchaeota archaeon]MBU4607255.1 4-oxalocrotonate tautomerase family protein [Euryarchaeota archaeon]MBV1754374.1 4-oxalocrotonate tautomerase family protein [Methanobacterium sp.]
MPVIHIDSNKLSRKQKRELVKAITKVSSEIMELPENTITIIIREVEAEDVGLGGQLLCDRDN